jgi:hypothetical protein
MSRFVASLSVSSLAIAMAIATAAGCKKDEKKEGAAGDPAKDPAAAGGDPAAGGGEAPSLPAGEGEAKDEEEEKPAGGVLAGGSTLNLSIEEACTRSISMMETMGQAVAGNKGNCDGMGAALQKWAEDNKDFIAWGKANQNNPALEKEFEEKCEPKMKPIMEKLGPTMVGVGECAENEKVKAALAVMGE